MSAVSFNPSEFPRIRFGTTRIEVTSNSIQYDFKIVDGPPAFPNALTVITSRHNSSFQIRRTIDSELLYTGEGFLPEWCYMALQTAHLPPFTESDLPLIIDGGEHNVPQRPNSTTPVAQSAISTQRTNLGHDAPVERSIPALSVDLNPAISRANRVHRPDTRTAPPISENNSSSGRNINNNNNTNIIDNNNNSNASGTNPPPGPTAQVNGASNFFEIFSNIPNGNGTNRNNDAIFDIGNMTIRSDNLNFFQDPGQKIKKATNESIKNLKEISLRDLPESERNCSICFDPFVRSNNEKTSTLSTSILQRLDEVETDPPIWFPVDPTGRQHSEYSSPHQSSTSNEKQKDDHKAVKMPCGHIFGHSCLIEWLKNHNSCPLCRAEIESVTPSLLTHKTYTPADWTTDIELTHFDPSIPFPIPSTGSRRRNANTIGVVSIDPMANLLRNLFSSNNLES